MSKTEELFLQLYDLWFPKVYVYFSVCFQEEAAKDLSQQTFMKLWQCRCAHPSFSADSWRAFLFRMAVNVKNDFLCQKRLQPNFCTYEDAFDPEKTSPSADPVVSVAVTQAFDKLSAADRELLALKRYGFDSKEIGCLLSLPDSTVRSRLSAARKRFCIFLKECGVNVDD